MSKRVLQIAVLMIGQVAAAEAYGAASTVFIQLFPLTGEIRIGNRDATPLPIVFYSIDSPSGALNSSPSVWKSISDTYDVSGNGLIDPVHNWVKISPSASTTQLSEGEVPDPGGSLPPLRSISFGKVWNPHKVPMPDLTYDFATSGGQHLAIQANYAVDGDYNGDGKVDNDDYVSWWKPAFGSTFDPSIDGNLNGIVDAADYTIWRDHLGAVLPLPPFGTGAGAGLQAAAVPEPTGVILAILGSVGAIAWRVRFRRNAWR